MARYQKRGGYHVGVSRHSQVGSSLVFGSGADMEVCGWNYSFLFFTFLTLIFNSVFYMDLILFCRCICTCGGARGKEIPHVQNVSMVETKSRF